MDSLPSLGYTVCPIIVRPTNERAEILMNAISELDSIVSRSLTSLARELSGGNWNGRREREVVSLFCFGHLLRHCTPGGVLHDPAQISIEVPVPQIPGQRNLTGKSISKAQVCKDIVIWPRPRMVTWDAQGKPTVAPLSIIEWKHNEREVFGYDVDWLCEFSTCTAEFVGYAVCTNPPSQEFTLSCTRVFGGRRAAQWLHIK